MGLLLGRTVRMAAFSVVAVGLLGLGGCNNEMKANNDALTAENTKLREENDTLQRSLSDAIRGRQEAEARATAREPQITDAGAATDRPARRTGESRSRGGETITVAGDVAFASGKVELQASGRRELDGIIARIRREYPDADIRIEGYTDSDPIRKSRWASNEALSEARAESVANYMASKGIARDRITAVGRGAANPKSTKAASRRVEIHILGN